MRKGVGVIILSGRNTLTIQSMIELTFCFAQDARPLARSSCEQRNNCKWIRCALQVAENNSTMRLDENGMAELFCNAINAAAHLP